MAIVDYCYWCGADCDPRDDWETEDGHAVCSEVCLDKCDLDDQEMDDAWSECAQP
jgi:hypothetical protein